ncbi:uncharacterized protein V6R79_002923 [Siganus canaliculatus]
MVLESEVFVINVKVWIEGFCCVKAVDVFPTLLDFGAYTVEDNECRVCPDPHLTLCNLHERMEDEGHEGADKDAYCKQKRAQQTEVFKDILRPHMCNVHAYPDDPRDVCGHILAEDLALFGNLSLNYFMNKEDILKMKSNEIVLSTVVQKPYRAAHYAKPAFPDISTATASVHPLRQASPIPTTTITVTTQGVT